MKTTVTLAISALNEEKNIASFISSVLEQVEDGFILENIWIFSDGSTDNTARIAQSFHNKKIKVFEYSSRAGKASRLNQAYAMLTSDILVQSDADVILAHPHVLRDLMQPMLEDGMVVMSGGNATPVEAKTFTEQAVNYTHEAYEKVKNEFKNGNNVFTVGGALLAFHKKFIKQVTLPKDVMAEDVYLYFLCLEKKYIYRYCPTAIVLYRSPQSLKDQIKQNTRFMGSEEKMLHYFPEKLVKEESLFPKNLIIGTMIRLALVHPFHCLYIFFVNRYCQWQANRLKNMMGSTWNMAQSTKIGISKQS